MTNTNCTECGTALTRRNRCASTDPEHYNTLCAACYECDDDMINETPVPVVHTATGRRNMSHAACSHPATTTARTACRRSRNA
jgi:hypothetical protein